MNRNNEEQEVILVDADDNPVGYETKLRAHQNGGKLHRAFSIFIFDDAERMLLQRRAQSKYHFGGLWTNACCGHPRRDEALHEAARRRLREELGFETEITELFSFLYRAPDPASGLTEHELDHVFWGTFDGQPRPDPDEVEDWKWIGLPDLMEDLGDNPLAYTPWFGMAVPRVIDALPAVCPRCSPGTTPDSGGRPT